MLFNVVLILILALDFAENARLALWLSIGVTTSGVLQAVLLWMVARSSGLKITLRVPRLQLERHAVTRE